MKETALSIAIITLNAERTLETTLKSLPIQTQIIILDSGSTDATQKISEKHGASFYHRKWQGFASQRTAATDYCTKNWVLYLDADEALSPELSKEICEKISLSDTGTAFRIRRLSKINQKYIKHGDWASDYVTRLVPREKATWIGEEPHPKLDESGLNVATLKHPLLHDPYASIAEYEKKIRDYAKQWAQSEFKRGRKTSLAEAVIRSAWRWLRGYVLRGGFLDGAEGALIAKMSAKMVIYKSEELKHLIKHSE